MTKARDYTKTESGIQLMKQLGGGRGATKKGLIKNLKKLFVKQKTVKSQESLTRAGKDLKLKKAGVLKVQKVNKGAKVPIEKLQQTQAIKTVVNKVNARTPIKIPKAQTQSPETSKKLTKFFDEAVNYKHKPYSKLSRKAKRDLKNRGITPKQYEID